MKEALTIVGSVIAALSFIPYLIDTAKKKVKPRLASWFSWSLITTITTIAAISAHAYAGAALAGASTFVEVSVLILGLRNGDITYGLIDGVSQTISIAGIIAWIFTKNPLWAIVLNITADFSGAIPTFYHGWVKPHEEQWQSFAIFALGSLITVFGVSKLTFTDLAIPVYFTCIAGSIGLDIYIRQRASLKT